MWKKQYFRICEISKWRNGEKKAIFNETVFDHTHREGHVRIWKLIS